MAFSFLVSPESIQQQQMLTSVQQNAYDTQMQDDLAKQRLAQQNQMLQARMDAQEQRFNQRESDMFERQANVFENQRNLLAQKDEASFRKKQVSDVQKAVMGALAPIDVQLDYYSKHPNDLPSVLDEKGNPVPSDQTKAFQTYLQALPQQRADLLNKLNDWQNTYMNASQGSQTPDFDWSNHPVFQMMNSPMNPDVKRRMDTQNALMQERIKYMEASMKRMSARANGVGGHNANSQSARDFAAFSGLVQQYTEQKQQWLDGHGGDPNGPWLSTVDPVTKATLQITMNNTYGKLADKTGRVKYWGNHGAYGKGWENDLINPLDSPPPGMPNLTPNSAPTQGGATPQAAGTSFLTAPKF